MRDLHEDLSGRILVVDDDVAVRGTLERFLVRLGHRVEGASSVAEALQKLPGGEYDLVITDLQMPGASGLDLLSEIRSRAPGTRTILMSGQAQTTDAAAAIERGVDRLLLKPFDPPVVRVAVEKALAEKRAQQKSARERELLQTMAEQRASESRTWILRAAHALAAAVEAKDAYTAGHASRVTTYAASLAKAVDRIDLSLFRLAGQLHDVGKIGVPDTVLNKADRLTEEEFALVKQHPLIGARILKPLIEDPLVIGVVRSHHERWDGRGYPAGLVGREIPLPARVLAVADTLDAMTSHRAYRRGLPWEVAVSEIYRCSGTQFDPRVVEAFEEVQPKLKKWYDSFVEEREASGVGGMLDTKGVQEEHT